MIGSRNISRSTSLISLALLLGCSADADPEVDGAGIPDPATTGGATSATGGTTATGGLPGSGTGGNGGSGGTSSAGGNVASGGTASGGTATGGRPASNGGSTSKGGSTANGGSTTGGSQASGGSVSEPVPTVPQRDALPCFVDDGTDAGDAIQVNLQPNRVSGVAPLSVFFDASDTTAADAERPFHDLAYCWDFGDATSGAFASTGLSKNQAKGPVAAHVFEKPGTYKVAVSARNADGLVSTRAVEITVQDPEQVYAEDATVCFSSSGDFAGCPAGAEHVTDAQLSALNDHIETGRRLLLRRGDTFEGGRVNINVAGPGTIGAFGEGARPRIESNTGLFRISGSTPRFTDWRIMDLEVVAEGDNALIAGVDGGARDLTLLRIKGTGISGGITASLGTINALNEDRDTPIHDAIDGLTMQEVELRDLVGGAAHNFVFAASHRLALLGNTFFNSKGGEHVVRLTWADRAVLSNNDFGEAPSPRHILKIHAPQFDQNGIGKGKYTERLVLSDNILRGTGGLDWMVTFGAQNGDYDERVRHVIVERNLFLPGSDAQVAIMVSAQDMTVRNNVFHRGNHAVAVRVEPRGLEPAPERVHLVNNTCYSTGNNGPTLVDISSSAKDVFAHNNLLAGTRSGGRVASGNDLTEDSSNIATTDPGFVSDEPTDWEDFELTAGSMAVDAGDDVATNAWDFQGQARPVDGGSGEPKLDVGALEYTP